MRVGWKPQPRPAWADALNAMGGNLAAGPASLLPLEQEELLATACEATGLKDFGDDWFREGLGRYLASLRDEAELNTCGRLMARQDVLRLLENRLLMQQHRRQSGQAGEGADSRDDSPLIVTGFARTGTTFLHELLACDSRHRSFSLAELMYPFSPVGNDHANALLERVATEATFMDLLYPGFKAMHDNAADLPTECIFAFAHEFASDLFVGAHEIPSYAAWLATTDLLPAYRAHRQFLRLLAGPDDDRSWLLKAPSHLNSLGALFAVYPAARVVVTHRDPLAVIASLADLMAALRWMRSDRVDYQALVAQMVGGYGWLAEQALVKRRELGEHEDQVVDLLYTDLVDDPAAAVMSLYEGWDMDTPAGLGESLRALVESRPRHRHGRHHYDFSDTGLDVADERGRFSNYQEHFGVASELD